MQRLTSELYYLVEPTTIVILVNWRKLFELRVTHNRIMKQLEGNTIGFGYIVLLLTAVIFDIFRQNGGCVLMAINKKFNLCYIQ